MEYFEKYLPLLSGWFTDIPKREINNLLIRQFEAGEQLVYRDHAFQNIYIILDSICNVINQLDNGTEVITLKLTCGYLIGVSESVLESTINIASVKACTRVVVAEMDERLFKKWIEMYPSFVKFVLKNLVTRLHYTSSFAANCHTSVSKINLTKYLLDRYFMGSSSVQQNNSGAVIIQETHELISNFLGLSRRTVERQIRALKKEGLIDIHKGKISISPSQYQRLLQLVTSNL